jgi:hypothetical protein
MVSSTFFAWDDHPTAGFKHFFMLGIEEKLQAMTADSEVV